MRAVAHDLLAGVAAVVRRHLGEGEHVDGAQFDDLGGDLGPRRRTWPRCAVRQRRLCLSCLRLAWRFFSRSRAARSLTVLPSRKMRRHRCGR